MKMFMLVLTIAMLASVVLSGCGFDNDNVNETAYQKRLKHKQIRYWNERQFNTEWEAFWLMDKNLRGSSYPVRVGN